MYKSVKEIQELINESKKRKYMSVSDKMMAAYNDEERNEKTKKANIERNKNPIYKEHLRKEMTKRKKSMNKGLKKLYEDNKKTGNLSKKLSERFRNCAKSRTVITPYGIFKCVADFGDLKVGTFNNLHNKIPHLYYYEDEGPGEILYEKVWYSPRGVKNSLKDIFELENEPVENRHIRGQWWEKMSKTNPKEYYTTSEPKREWRLEKP